MSNLQIRIDENLKMNAKKVAEQIGMDLTTAVRIFLSQMVIDNGLPFKPMADDFYSSPNLKHLETSVEQIKRGDTVTKKIDDLLKLER